MARLFAGAVPNAERANSVCQNGVSLSALTAMPSEGLYANIRKRRAAGKKPRKPGSKGAPTAKDFKNAARTAKAKPKKKGSK